MFQTGSVDYGTTDEVMNWLVLGNNLVELGCFKIMGSVAVSEGAFFFRR